MICHLNLHVSFHLRGKNSTVAYCGPSPHLIPGAWQPGPSRAQKSRAVWNAALPRWLQGKAWLGHRCSPKICAAFLKSGIPQNGGYPKMGGLDIFVMENPSTSSTAQGGGGSFKNRKPFGEIGCCESGMAERIHWWTERCLRSPLFLSLSLTIYLPTYLSSMYLSIYLSIDRSIYRSIDLSIYRSIYLSISLPLVHLITYLSIYLI